MTLTEEQNDELEDMLETIMNSKEKLTEWEVAFIEDNYKRWQVYGNRIMLSEKQWTVIHRLYQKVME